MAYTMNASWIVVYVESSKPLTGSAKAQLISNLKLAGELGAETITTADEDFAQALVRVAHQQNATQILIGKTRRYFSFVSTSLDRLIELSGDLDVYVVGEHLAGTSSKKKFTAPVIHSGFAQYGLAAAIVCLVALACYPIASYLGYQTVSLILLLVVALMPLKFGVGPVLLAAGLSALVWDFFFIPPQFTFVVARGQDILMLVAYFAIAAVTGTLTARIRAREKGVRQREERATALYTLTKDLSTSATQNDVAQAAVMNIKKFFDAEIAVFLSQPDGDVFTKAHSASTYEIGEKEFSVAAWAYWNEKKAGKFTDTLPFAQATYYPMSGPRYPLGVIGVNLHGTQQLPFEQETLLQNFVSQIGSTLEREQLNEIAKRSIAFEESERLYKTLFNSISHELRTPIAAIVSASEGLLDDNASSRSEVKKDLTHEIHTAAERLNRLVDNLLDMTRLESGRISPTLDWCDLRDLINSTTQKLSRELSGHDIKIDVAPDMPLVKVDFGLIEQAVTNLLHNASLYTPRGSMVSIQVFTDAREAVIVIADNGPGFPQESLSKVFEKFYRVPGTKTGGTGLGLSIARGFVEAHKGTIKVEDREEGGARFIIRLPLQSQNQAGLNPPE
jgi:two-component system sensor histidine kinase KdpD